MGDNQRISDAARPQTGLLDPQAVQVNFLGPRLFAHAVARIGVAILIVAGSLFARYVIGVTPLSVPGLSIVAAAILAYGIPLLVLARPFRAPLAAGPGRRGERIAEVSIVLDFMALTAVLWFLGGARSPFLTIYMLHIGIASILLSRRAAYFSAILAAVMLAGLIVVETTGVLPPPAPHGATPGDGPLDTRYIVTILFVYVAMFWLIVASQTQMARALRKAEEHAHDRALQSERLSRMRRDFLHVALHDVGAPIATAEMLLGNLRDGLCGPLEPQQAEQVGRAISKLQRLQSLVRDLRVLSELDSTDLRAHSTEIPLSLVLESVVEECSDAARDKKLTLEIEPSDRGAIVVGVPRLVREAITNYVDNAIKYTPTGGRVTARIRPVDRRLRVEVSDTGVGIAPAQRHRLFQEFSRLECDHPDLRGARGVGLGLSIVRRIAEAHQGSVGVDGEPGQGSTFWIEFPACGTAHAGHHSTDSRQL
ncbi:MAG: HAMP domain-containing histidine kinase [Phycisphaerales bacterium]|nr:HAMP domain-containing histidine kinase [Phycisphaerales bacterium]